MVDFWDVLHDGIYLGMVQKAETCLTKEDIESMFKIQWFGMMHLDDPFLEAEARKREEVPRQDFFT